MHYPSDVLAGVLLGTLIGGLVPGVGERTLEERMLDFVADRGHEEDAVNADGEPPEGAG
jgi:TctA family transporter